MAAKKGQYDIPFDKDGNQLDYPENWRPLTWVPNFTFEDTLEVVSYGRGRSSITFTLRRSSGTIVSMFVSDFYVALKHMVRGQITGRFTFVKKGQNYGCALVQD